MQKYSLRVSSPLENASQRNASCGKKSASWDECASSISSSSSSPARGKISYNRVVHSSGTVHYDMARTVVDRHSRSKRPYKKLCGDGKHPLALTGRCFGSNYFVSQQLYANEIGTLVPIRAQEGGVPRSSWSS